MSRQVKIRKPLRNEIEQLAELGSRLFQQTFDGLYSDKDLQAFLDRVHSPESVAYDWDHGCEYWIAEAEGQGGDPGSWVGYCKVGKVKVPIEVGDHRVLELRQIYVDRNFHRCGIGAAFMKQFFELCNARQIEMAYVSCYTENKQALAFYARYGFEVIGTYDFEIGEHRDQDYILCKHL